MKRFQCVAILAAAMLLCATGKAFADKATTYTLKPTSRDFPNAAGSVTISYTVSYSPGGWGSPGGHQYWGDESFQCSGLAPNTAYYLLSDKSTSGTIFVMDANGHGSHFTWWHYTSWKKTSYYFPQSFHVTDANTSVVVLSSK